MKILHVLLFVLLVTNNLFSQKNTDANIIGDITSNNEHLPFATVIIEGTTIGTSSDATGHFMLVNLPFGTHTIIAQSIGYKSQKKQITISASQTIELKFNLELDNIGIEQVVVSSDRNEIKREDALSLVNVISPKLLESSNSVCLADGLNFSPGVRTENNCQNCGFSQVRMNGLEGHYSQILINSRPIFSGLASVYGLELIPTSMIQRVEIVRGGGSAIFGGNAIAGTINVITKDPIKTSFKLGSKYKIIGIPNKSSNGDPAVAKCINFNGSMVTDDKKSGFMVYGLSRNRDAYDIDYDSFTEVVSIKGLTVGINAFHRLTSKSKISLAYYRINEFRRGGNKLELLPHEADIAEQIDHDINGGSLEYTLFTSKNKKDKFTAYISGQNIQRNTYYGALQDHDAYGNTIGNTFSAGSQYTTYINKLLFAPAKLTLGLENTTDIIKDSKLGTNLSGNNLITNQNINTSGLYVQNEWNTKKVKYLLGYRVDHFRIKDRISSNNNIRNTVFIPRGSILFNINSGLQYRLSISSGYRAPQIFDEDLHIEASGSKRITHKNAVGLAQETSASLTTSINYKRRIGKLYTETLIEGFVTKLYNPFTTDLEQDTLNNYIYVRRNASDGAKVAGINFEINASPGNHLKLQLGYTLQQSKYESPQKWGLEEDNLSVNFTRTPNNYGFFALSYTPKDHFHINVNGNYTGSMFIPHLGISVDSLTSTSKLQAIANGEIIEGEKLEVSETFFIIGLKIGYDFKLTNETIIEASIGVKNLFNQIQPYYDKGVYRDAGYIYGPNMPRSISFGLKFTNNH